MHSTRSYVDRVSEYVWKLTSKVTDLVKPTTENEYLKELYSVVANQKNLLEWFKQEEKSFIDLKEMSEISNKYTKPDAIDRTIYPQLQYDTDQISQMKFHQLVANLRTGISYLDEIIKRYEAIIEASEFYEIKKLELEKEKTKADPTALPKFEKQELYLDNTKRNLKEERNQMCHMCRVDLTLTLTTLNSILQGLNNNVLSY